MVKLDTYLLFFIHLTIIRYTDNYHKDIKTSQQNTDYSGCRF